MKLAKPLCPKNLGALQLTHQFRKLQKLKIPDLSSPLQPSPPPLSPVSILWAKKKQVSLDFFSLFTISIDLLCHLRSILYLFSSLICESRVLFEISWLILWKFVLAGDYATSKFVPLALIWICKHYDFLSFYLLYFFSGV